MVRGNWQKRVESAQARREEERARKARKGDREAHRQMASGLMSFLAGRSADDANKMLHVWVDSDPRKSSGGGGGGGGGRAPAQDSGGGFDSDDDDGGGKKRGKKGGKKQSARRPQQGSAKKAHPRQGLKNSHHFDDDEGTSAADAQELCVRHFFFNKCAGSAAGNKKGGGKGSAALCKLQHMRDPTLALALKKSRDAEADIAASATAVIQASAGDGEDEDVGAASIAEDAGMSMLWHLPVRLKDEMEDGKGINEILQSHLSRSKLGAASIVYVVLGEKLLYDRNREGVMEESHSTAEEATDGEKVPPRKHGRSRGESMAERKGSICDGEEDDEASILLNFPASVLESILTYLPDMYTGNLPYICKAWYAEIGRTSPNLWFELIRRHGLPLPVEKSTEGFLLPAGMDADTAGSPRDVCRDAFIAHYEAFRDMRAVHELFLKLQGQTSHDTSIAPTEACVMNYNSSPGAPREGSGRSTSMKVWSEGKVLVAFEEDCTLRLFEAASAGGSSLVCRQTVSVIVSPEPRSKRGQWELTGMDVDSSYIGCICQVPDLTGEEYRQLKYEVKSPVMRIIKREDLLCASGGGSDNRPVELDPDDVLSIDLRNTVCQHLLNDCLADLLSSTLESDVDLVDLLENEERSDLILYVSGDVVACSRGRFLFKGALLTRDMALVEEEPVSFRAYLYSVSARKIVWSEIMHVSAPFSLPFTRMFRRTIASASTSSVVIPHPGTFRTSKIDVSKDGAVECYDMAFDSSQLAAITTEKRSWDDYDEDVQINMFSFGDPTTYLWRPALLTSTDIFITCNEVYYNAPSGDVKTRTVVTFSSPTTCSIDSDCGWEGATTEVLALKGRCRIDDMHPVGPDHVLLIGRMLPDEPNRHRATQVGDGDDGNGENENNDIAGEWFGVADDDADDEEDGGNNGDEGNVRGDLTDEAGYYIFLVHIPSRKEIKRYLMVPGPRREPHFRFVSGSNTMIGLEIGGPGGGLIMSGRGVRDVVGAKTASNRSDDVVPKSKKKKRQATRAKGRNKDGFARGMSGRG